MEDFHTSVANIPHKKSLNCHFATVLANFGIITTVICACYCVHYSIKEKSRYLDSYSKYREFKLMYCVRYGLNLGF